MASIYICTRLSINCVVYAYIFAILKRKRCNIHRCEHEKELKLSPNSKININRIMYSNFFCVIILHNYNDSKYVCLVSHYIIH